MRILGINEFSHDCAAALVENDRIVCVGEEERYSRKKHHFGFIRAGSPPDRAIEWIVNEQRLNGVGEFDGVALAWKTGLAGWLENRIRGRRTYLRGGYRRENLCEFASMIARGHVARRAFLKQLRSYGKPVVEVEHHLAHAALSYRLSSFEEALIFVLDGAGERIATSVSVGRGNRIERLRSYPIEQSAGLFYANVTMLCGQGRHGEGKCMGLAGYGDPMEDRLFRYYEEGDRFQANGKLLKRLWRDLSEECGDMSVLARNIAATAQRDLEEAICRFVEAWIKKTGIRRICIGGGGALNCKLNGLIFQRESVDELFVPPAPSDAGVALGAALEASARYSPCFGLNIERADFGQQFSSNEVRLASKAYDGEARIVHSDEAEKAVSTADDLLRGMIVGWFQGKAECGPRALGCRSLLADIHQEGIKSVLNEIKSREAWRPYGIALLEEDVQELFGVQISAPFMNVALPARHDFLRPISHVDGTVRFQTVTKDTSLSLFELLKQIKATTGFGVVLNTSLNCRGEPLVNSPDEALHLFQRTPLEVLYIGNRRFSKV